MVASLTAKHLSIHINSCSTKFASLTPNRLLSNSWTTSIRPQYKHPVISPSPHSHPATTSPSNRQSSSLEPTFHRHDNFRGQQLQRPWPEIGRGSCLSLPPRQLDPLFPTTSSLVLDTTPIHAGLCPIQLPLNGQPSNIAFDSQCSHSLTSTQTSETRETRHLEDDGKDGGMNEQTTQEREVVVEEAIALEGEEITCLL